MFFKRIKMLPFLFLCACMRFYAFRVCLKNKTASIPSFILLLTNHLTNASTPPTLARYPRKHTAHVPHAYTNHHRQLLTFLLPKRQTNNYYVTTTKKYYKTNNTLRNNGANYLLWEKGLKKTEKSYHQALGVQWGT